MNHESNKLYHKCSHHSTEPAVISLQASRPALWGNENSTLICTADGGYPPTSNISWVKNGSVISTATTNQLTITVAASDNNPFGQYVCLVNNTVTTTETLFLMKEKGDDNNSAFYLIRIHAYACSYSFR